MTVMHSTVHSNDGNLFVVNYQLLRAEITPTVLLKAMNGMNGLMETVYGELYSTVQCTVYTYSTI